MKGFRSSWVEIDSDALAHNARLISDLVAPASLIAVVKADGYGHGAIEASRAALAGGARSLAVALVEEAIEFRDAGIAAPILVLSEPPREAMDEVARQDLMPTIYTADGLAAVQQAARDAGHAIAVHLKVDTGMHRVGCDPSEAFSIASAIVEAKELVFEGFWTHFSVADEPADPYTDLQLDRFLSCLAELRAQEIAPRLTHAANSAAALNNPRARLDAVRCGIALYGYAPSEATGEAVQGELSSGGGLRPVLSLRSRVHAVRELASGERPSYGRARELKATTRVATVPLGYADGVRRSLAERDAEVLIGGSRRRFAGTVTMDQVLIDCGDDASVAVGDEVVFIGEQGGEEITAEEWAGYMGTITYEVLCGIGPRVPRLVTSHTEDSPESATDVRR